MPQKRMAARGQSAKLAKGPSLSKTKDLAKKAKLNVTPAAKSKINAKAALKSVAAKPTAAGKPAAVAKAAKGVKPAAPHAQIEKAKAALKTAFKTPAPVAASAPVPTPAPELASTAVTAVKATAKTVKEAKAKPEGKRGRKISIDINPNEAASALSGKWSTLFKKAEQIEAKPYNMKAVFEEKTAITHKVLGWGYILANRNDRLEVLFKDGIKYLISNYKP